MEKKQSSIDYFFEEVVKWEMRPWLYASDGLEAIREKAKAMHKEEIIKANRDGVDMGIAEQKYITGEQYYNETFGGDNE